ncbi:MAG: helix-turn-helix domain-containing protein [Candidatus Tectomicrobia bacterium]|uniref:Helix-turn-helix domain-containing protein n=1 Tax=Tectimicrobiota bacterium TaxID=2528274 RepID=A0A932GRL6_UNCTE|nr:helix-turn-helix domain-containing protein [Candidatus Tectomicrobia bacterium]
MSFGTFIRNRRTSLGISLRLAAQKLGVDPAYLSRVEAGKVPPSEQLIHRLARFLECPEDEILLLAGRLPEPIRAMVVRQPYRVAAALRTIAEMCAADPGAPYGKPLFAVQGERAIEDGFPFEEVSEIAEVESWRKEIYRPIYHVHKWWAQRLGSVFRAAILGAAAPKGSSVTDLFYEPVRLPGVVVFDPFMGSGTTVGEAQKLGCTVIGRDINAVAYRAVRVALGPVDRREVHALYCKLESTVGKEIKKLYRSVDGEGQPCDVLYFFWVKVIPCPHCRASVDLFTSYVFATHAYKERNPGAKITCPECSDVLSGRQDDTETICRCGTRFNPQEGPAKRTTAVCRSCGHEFPIAKTARSAGKPPDHRLYAKLVLRKDGTKGYHRVTDDDLAAFHTARERLRNINPPLPRVPIADGHNTRQILNYGYRNWYELFNERQLLALSMLAGAIRDLPEGPAREALAVLFSGVLEFNNMFASYKGEGTGAVRHMFSHHILKPERTPIEANLWGTPKSSGSFSTLYLSRLLRALDYREAPFELAVEYAGRRKTGRKVVGISPPMGGPVVERCPKSGLKPGSTYLSCGDSSATDLPDGSVDLVITDPPFFYNVHFSELADFFFVWQQLYFGDGRSKGASTTRRNTEVQDTEADAFADKLKRVFAECHRVLRDEGLLVFSYHHSREDGWAALARAVRDAGFTIVQSQPVKAEMSVAAPKSQAKEPIDLDVLLVCRKRNSDHRIRSEQNVALQRAVASTSQKVSRFNGVGRQLSRNDVRVVLLSQLLVEMSVGRTADEVSAALEVVLPRTRGIIEKTWREQEICALPGPVAPQPGSVQLDLLEPASIGGREA